MSRYNSPESSPDQSSPLSVNSSPHEVSWRPRSRRPTPPPVSQIDVPSLPFHQYEPLPQLDDSIRLVRLHPADPLHPKVPQCSLEVHFLDFHPPYCALSYSWGQPEEIEELIGDQDAWVDLENDYNGSKLFECVLDGQLFPARLNLIDFLNTMGKRLADPAFVGFDLFWIDAMCVNQQDLEERNEQVSMMGRIYREADRVLVWLGYDIRGDMPLVKSMVYKLLDMARDVVKDMDQDEMDWPELWTSHVDQQHYLTKHELPLLDDATWLAFCAFFRRSWFFRLWILQEVALAREIVMLCGDVEFEIIDLDTCSSVLRWGIGHQLGQRWGRHYDLSFRPVGTTTHRVCQVLRWCQLKEPPINDQGDRCLRLALNGTAGLDNAGAVWHMLLDTCQSAKFSEPVDNVFGLIGIIEHIMPNMPATIVVDYMRSVTEVRIGIWSYIAEQTQWLNMLCRVQHFQDGILMGSWAPALAEYIGNYIFLSVNFNASLSLKEDGMTENLPTFSTINSSELLVSGVKIGKITSVGDYHITAMEKPEDGIMRVVDTCDNIYHHTGESLFRAVWKTMMAWKGFNTVDESPDEDFISQGGPSHRLHDQAYQYWLHTRAMFIHSKWPEQVGTDQETDFRLEALRILAKHCPNLDTFLKREIGHGFPTMKETIEMVQLWKTIEAKQKSEKNSNEVSVNPVNQGYEATQGFRFMIGKYAAQRRLFKTDSGHIGLGPDIMQEGDEVWIIPRTTVPIILRPIYIPLANEPGPESMKDYKTRTREADQTYNARLFAVLGESYVHGIMLGEFVAECRARATEAGKDWEWERIILV